MKLYSSKELGPIRDFKQEDQEIEKYLSHHHLWKQKLVSQWDKDKVRRLIVKTQRYVRSGQASRQMFSAEIRTYWDLVKEMNEPDGDDIRIPVDFNPSYPRHQLARLSYYNLKNLLINLGKLTNWEKRFWCIFNNLNFELTHYTQRSNQIISSGRILSNQRVREVVKDELKLSNSSAEDLEYLCNGNYVFFRFEIIHKNDKESRFGKEQLIFDAKNSGFFKTGWISLIEMLHPRATSIIESLEYKGHIVRSLAEADESEEDEDEDKYKDSKDDEAHLERYRKEIIIPFNYLDGPASQEHLHIVRNIFNGPDILPGLAFAIIRELRLIGGVMKSDFRQLIVNWATNEEENPTEYNKQLTQLNHFLSLLFRVEAKFPGVFYLDQKYYLIDGRKIKNIIARDDVQTLEKILAKTDLNEMCVENGAANDDQEATKIEAKTENVTPLIAAAINGSAQVIAWLLQQRANPAIADSSGKVYTDYLTTGLFNCISLDELEKLKSFLAFYPDKLELVDENNNTILLFAAYRGHSAIIKYLLSIGAKATHINSFGHHYLYALAKCAIKMQKENNQRAYVKLTEQFPEIFIYMPPLIQTNLRYEQVPQQMFYYIKDKRNYDFQQLFILFSMFANIVDENGNNFLIYAMMVKNFKIAPWLLRQRHLKKDTRNALGQNYLDWLRIHSIEYIKNEEISFVLWLLKQFPQFRGDIFHDENEQSLSSKDLLCIAMNSRSIYTCDLVCELLKRDADPTKVSKPGLIYHFLAKGGHLELIKKIHQRAPGIPLDFCDDKKNTPLIVAVGYKHFKMAKWFLENMPLKNLYKYNIHRPNYYEQLKKIYVSSEFLEQQQILKLFPFLRQDLITTRTPKIASIAPQKPRLKRKGSFLESGGDKRQLNSITKKEQECESWKTDVTIGRQK